MAVFLRSKVNNISAMVVDLTWWCLCKMFDELLKQKCDLPILSKTVKNHNISNFAAK